MLDIMRGKEDSRPPPGDLMKECEDLAADFGIQIPRWLIRKEEHGRTDKGPGDTGALLLTTG